MTAEAFLRKSQCLPAYGEALARARGWAHEGDALWPLYAPIVHADPARPFVVAQLGQSLDGRIATPTGASHFINGPAALDHLHRVRALVDVVVVGIGTVLADDCRLTVRRVEGRSPARCVIDPSGRLPPDAQLLAEDGAPRLLIRGEDGPVPFGCELLRVPRDASGRLKPSAIASALARRGFRRILVEGGAHTVSAFVADGAVDRLHVSVAPLLIGSGQPGLVLPPIDGLGEATRPPTRVFPLPGGDVVFDCDLGAARRGDGNGDSG